MTQKESKKRWPSLCLGAVAAADGGGGHGGGDHSGGDDGGG